MNSIMETAPGHVPEPRTAMMALARVSWEDQDGTPQTHSARIEDMSPSGACIRLKAPIPVGVRIHVSWHRGQFSAQTKYCRKEYSEFIVGMQREKDSPLPDSSSRPSFHIATPESRPVLPKTHSVPAAQKNSKNSPIFIRPPEPLPLVPVTFPPPVIERPVIGFEIASRNPPRAMFQNDTSTFEETTDMQNKWLNIGSKRAPHDGAKPRALGALPASDGSALDAPADAISPASLGTPQGDLLPLEDIYRSAGVVAPRLGYSINKIIDMLNSDHLRGLPAESKRASLLMALDAAGISLDAILQDATQRQSAIASYESSQRRKFEEYWSRKAEENSLLQAEMERVTRQYVERMNRNLNEVAQEKEAFQKWQSLLQQETDQITEAVSVCAKPAAASESAPEAASASLLSAAGSLPAASSASSATPSTSSPAGAASSQTAPHAKSDLVAKSA
ncbi:MAG TPA: hypothetical protein VMU43_06770 [Candidatus Acidoferrum sp.]|nr:hypothetical protein [Candidatus Acidoferrum sp.]